MDEQFSRLKEGLQQKLEEILKGEQKNSVTIPEITSRLDQHLQQKLEEDELSTTAFSVTIEKENSEKEKIDLRNVYEGVAKKIAGEIHSADNFENWSLVAIFEMLEKRILKPEEISSDNFMEIAKSYHKYESIFNKIISARMNGDYAYEKAFILQERKIEEPSKKISKKSTSLTLTQLVKRYCDTQIKDGAWKAHMLADHKIRLDNLTDILGEKFVEDVSREDMRHLRDILEKLPPGRKKNPKFKNLSCEKIISLNPSPTLSVKTVNDRVRDLQQKERPWHNG